MDNEEACDHGHMMHHMTWCHKPKNLRERAGRIMSRYMSIVCLLHGKCMDIRVGLFIVSMDHVLLVYII